MNKIIRQLKLCKSNWLKKMSNSNGFLISMKRSSIDLRIISQGVCQILREDWVIWSIGLRAIRHRKMRLTMLEKWMKMKNSSMKSKYRICSYKLIAWVNISSFKIWIVLNLIKVHSKWITQQVTMFHQEMIFLMLRHKIFLRNYQMSI